MPLSAPAGDQPDIASWPALPFHEWKDTCATLHLRSQIAAKGRLTQFKSAYEAAAEPGKWRRNEREYHGPQPERADV